MKTKIKISLFIIVLGASLATGCRSTSTEAAGEFGGMNQQMAAQLRATRAQLKAAGASAAQLRDFDRQAAAMNKAMGQATRNMERQMKALEAANP